MDTGVFKVERRRRRLGRPRLAIKLAIKHHSSDLYGTPPLQKT